MPSTCHELIVSQLASTVPGFKIKKFRRAIRDAIVLMNPYDEYKKRNPEDDSSEDAHYRSLFWGAGVDRLHMVPDGYTIEVASSRYGKLFCELHVYEVEVTNNFNFHKMAQLGTFADNTDAGDFCVTLHIIDRFGREALVMEDDDLMFFAFAYLHDKTFDAREYLRELQTSRQSKQAA